jgi:hypothetical protein
MTFFSFERTNFGIIHIRTDGERVLALTHSGKKGLNEAYQFTVDSRHRINFAKKVKVRNQVHERLVNPTGDAEVPLEAVVVYGQILNLACGPQAESSQVAGQRRRHRASGASELATSGSGRSFGSYFYACASYEPSVLPPWWRSCSQRTQPASKRRSRTRSQKRSNQVA